MTVVYIDVDDTLVRSFGSKQISISHMISLVRELKNAGAELYCWSSGGAAYARGVAERFEIADCFVTFLPKPNLMLDDVNVSAWNLVQLHPTECGSRSAQELLAKVKHP